MNVETVIKKGQNVVDSIIKEIEMDIKKGQFIVDNTGKTWTVEDIEFVDGETIYCVSDEDGLTKELSIGCILAQIA